MAQDTQTTGLDDLLGQREIDSPDAMEQLGRDMGSRLRAGDVLVLTGPLGAGKTTLTRGIAESLGVRGPIQSPTFVIARTHPSLVGGVPLVHVDAYRLGSAAELDDLDIDFAGSVVVVEWGAPFAGAVTDSWWEVELDREWHGRGVDTACGTYSQATLALDADTPRLVTISRRP
ncbi:tRNA (adenosine(37)-N6)-threonylcarbamoyltransferase complex ATPase subunit type 1 TsaE [Microbacterium sp. cx-55]|uniref:tRNA (adenosine(37)-N6)-threonylcarbamoyltransferase complex ATPase subunit type 1 TsaE n=1 Tax=unclassified Microbacterium TaxID=2609290 RepID=UPI001CBB98B4|nr:MULTISPECIES: tRNA (adenosine(37)-N6)-threonylcarbamoyltransferase complex ATPase subunit type 1 TsaE [unclassified Microbacterium]MBZ4486921.1 tRNA (adenosine(37)-N6)-threonylcarbamoyltransferase complex ATPase subunit type 1 TsaE [Microbacterium sp. cx-55]MCC4908012.1 tRNA (adenosine(37)-N6)-threonylcarbamoyltransferase complex ATPase subunit type 1 TsaE [Microbacterium sp. cx-59]UGB35843.1 tRNA (adenosine(37)-N6)-threonylcarbamoyltransferase complex ATPase subunit type 1 TsaE [Microbacteri